MGYLAAYHKPAPARNPVTVSNFDPDSTRCPLGKKYRAPRAGGMLT
jgi:hypothetical protein